MTSAALAVCTPHFQWYAILLVMLVALDGRPEWLAIAAGGYLANNPNLRVDGFVVHDSRLAGWGAGTAIACTFALARYFIERRARTVEALAEVEAGIAVEAVTAADAASASMEAPAPVEPVIEPTAVYARTAVSVTIGTDGSPAFGTADVGEPAAS